MTELPAPVSEAFDATDRGDLSRFVAAFAKDGVVDDGGRAFRGHDAISAWSRRESIGVKQTFAINEARNQGEQVIVKATVGGGGYTGPATFTFTLTSDGAAIQSMVITG